MADRAEAGLGWPALAFGRVGWGAARAAHLPGVAGHPAGVAKGAAEQELDLGIGAAHLIGGPLGEGVVDRRVETQQYALAFGHLARH